MVRHALRALRIGGEAGGQTAPDRCGGKRVVLRDLLWRAGAGKARQEHVLLKRNLADPEDADGERLAQVEFLSPALQVVRAAVRILHLDHPCGDAAALAGPAPAAILGIEAGAIAPERPADLMILKAWRFDQVIARPQADRRLLRGGRPAMAQPSSYASLASGAW